MTIVERDRRAIWHPYTPLVGAPAPIAIARAEGAALYTESGDRIIDGISSWWVNIHGHCHPYLAECMRRQMERLDHVLFAGCTHEPAVTLAVQLLEVLPGQARVFYSDNGSTAVEVALKMALQFWWNQDRARTRIAVLDGSYHGDTVGAMSVSARGLFTAPFDPWLFGVDSVPVPEPGCEDAAIESLRAILDRGETAACIVEPLVLGAGGMRMYPPAALDRVIECCREYGVLVIADEVMTGFGRTGRLFACDWLRNRPDIVALSKGITGGVMALGATTCSSEVYEAFRTGDRSKAFFHGHSYTANPIACAVAAGSLELLRREETGASIERITARHGSAADELRGDARFERIRQCGTILALDLRTAGQPGYLNTARDILYHHALSRGVLLRPLGNTVYVMPPYCIDDGDLGTIYDTIRSFPDLRGDP